MAGSVTGRGAPGSGRSRTLNLGAHVMGRSLLLPLGLAALLAGAWLAPGDLAPAGPAQVDGERAPGRANEEEPPTGGPRAGDEVPVATAGRAPAAPTGAAVAPEICPEPAAPGSYCGSWPERLPCPAASSACRGAWT